MNYRTVARLIGVLVLIIGLSMGTSLIWAVANDEEGARRAFLLSMAVCLFMGLVLIMMSRDRDVGSVFRKEGLGVVALGWIVAAGVGSLPYLFAGVFTNPVDAYFEAMSGFTTTGSTVLRNIEAVPSSILFWRDFTQWLGGIGIVVLFIAILPQMGVGARHLFRSEIPGAVKEGMSPRIKDTAVLLLGIYLSITTLEVLFLLIGGMSFFDALCHTFGTVATGGFSPKNASIAAYDSLFIQLTIVVFTIFAGTNFSLYFLLVRRRYRQFFRDTEWRVYMATIFVASLLISGDLFLSGTLPALGDAMRHGLFQAVSMQTTTGFVTQDFDQWPTFSRLLLVVLMFLGGCSGSTTGGMKVTRAIVLVKYTYFAVYHWFRPHAVVSMRVGRMRINDETTQAIVSFFILLMGLFVLSAIILALLGMDLVTAVTAVAATITNTGPGLAGVGAVQHFAHVPSVGKVVLSFCMLLGRLELFTVMVLFIPAFWRR